MVNYGRKRCVAPPERVILRIQNQEDGGEDVYKIGVHVQLKKLMHVYCEKRNFYYKIARFIYNGNLVKPRQTPAQLMMKDHHLIQMFTERA